MARVAIEVGGLDLIHLQSLIVLLCIALLYISLFGAVCWHRLCSDEKAV